MNIVTQSADLHVHEARSAAEPTDGQLAERRPAVAPYEDRRAEPVDFVDQSRAQKCRRQLAAPFHEKLRQALAPEAAERGAKGNVSFAQREFEKRRARRRHGATPARRRGRAAQYPRQGTVVAVQLCADGNAKLRVDQHALRPVDDAYRL